MSNRSVIDLSDLAGLSQPLTKLVEVVGAFIGEERLPARIREHARAEVDAKLMHAEADLDVQEMQRAARAGRRISWQELRRQRNIESVVQGAARELPSSVGPEPVDEDWITDFFGYCEDVGNQTMQSVWSRILAGEVVEPGSFSIRTLAVVRMLTPDDAQLFEKTCRYIASLGDWQALLATVETDSFLEREREIMGLHFHHLEALGLIQNGPYTVDFSFGRRHVFQYGAKALSLVPSIRYYGEGYKRPSPLRIRHFTEVGHQLLRLVSSEPDYAFLDVLTSSLRAKDIQVQEVEEAGDPKV